MHNDFLNSLLDIFTTNHVGEFIPRHDLSPATRALVAAYFDGQDDEAGRYADHYVKTYTHPPAWIKELAEHYNTINR